MSGMFLYHLITEEEFFHLLSDVLFRMLVLILWSICLLICLILVLAGLISLQVGLLANFSL